MLEVLDRLRRLTHEARIVDAGVIRGRVAVVRRNIIQIGGMNRSDNFVRRCAGLSNDSYRKSVTERAVEWYGATAMESPMQALRVRAYWEEVFDSTPIIEPFVSPDWWTLEEECDSLLSKIRRCHIDGDRGEEKLALIHLRGQIDAMIRLVNADVPADARAR